MNTTTSPTPIRTSIQDEFEQLKQRKGNNNSNTTRPPTSLFDLDDDDIKDIVFKANNVYRKDKGMLDDDDDTVQATIQTTKQIMKSPYAPSTTTSPQPIKKPTSPLNISKTSTTSTSQLSQPSQSSSITGNSCQYNTEQFIALCIGALCTTLNHYSYLIFLVTYLALSSSLPSSPLTPLTPLPTTHNSIDQVTNIITTTTSSINTNGFIMMVALGGILHALIAGSIVTIALPMSENPHLSRNQRLARQCGHTLMLSHFAGLGSIAEMVRGYYGVDGWRIDKAVESIWWQFSTITLLKPFILVPIYQHLALILTKAPTKIINTLGEGGLDGDLITKGSNTLNHFNLSPYDLTYYLGYSCFIIICMNFLLPIITYAFIVDIHQVGKDEFEQVE